MFYIKNKLATYGSGLPFLFSTCTHLPFCFRLWFKAARVSHQKLSRCQCHACRLPSLYTPPEQTCKLARLSYSVRTGREKKDQDMLHLPQLMLFQDWIIKDRPTLTHLLTSLLKSKPESHTPRILALLSTLVLLLFSTTLPGQDWGGSHACILEQLLSYRAFHGFLPNLSNPGQLPTLGRGLDYHCMDKLRSKAIGKSLTHVNSNIHTGMQMHTFTYLHTHHTHTYHKQPTHHIYHTYI